MHMNDDDAARELIKAIDEATARRIARTQEMLDQSAIRPNSIPKKSRKTSVFHRALR
jgi:hypothetical protein